ncbi:uncharacterized protein LOC143514007 isoform X1 [Brachyhypopomus gauderio]|uniref:uncharacterized protein LOC143514007 isoform X1 n=1 Tax=Brachyhypopomus gauderio TaxID=698409 RepID=UPI004042FE12
MNAVGKQYEWRLFDGQQWFSICNDHIIESNYCQPGARGMTINTHLGSLYIDFDAMTVRGPFAGLRVQRQVFISYSQTQEMGWYFKDNRHWQEYGTQGTSSVNSQILEQWYNTNPRGSFQFTVGTTAYTIDFSAMTQTRQSTDMRRKVRRRPKFKSIGAVDSSFIDTLSPMSTTPSINSYIGVTWEFMADEGIWMEYQKPGSSLDSVDIEKQYQLNPHSQLTFTAGRNSYTLDFNGMYQTNIVFGTKRHVRRSVGRNQHNSSSFTDTSSPLSTTPSINSSIGVTWEFMADEGIWTEYQKPGSSLDSVDIEKQYQLNPHSQLTFTAGRNSYTLDFNGMYQTNIVFGTKRHVRRSVGRNQHNSSSFTDTSSPLSTTPSINSSIGVTWEFMADEGIWTEYQKPGSSLDSVDIEKQYQLNPHGQLTFTAGRYSYTLDFSGMYQTNIRFGTKRNVQRSVGGNQHNSSSFTDTSSPLSTTSSINSSIGVTWEFMVDEGIWMEYQKPSSSLDSVDIEKQYQLNPHGQLTFTAGRNSYTLDFNGMYQTNIVFGTKRHVRRSVGRNQYNSSTT